MSKQKLLQTVFMLSSVLMGLGIGGCKAQKPVKVDATPVATEPPIPVWSDERQRYVCPAKWETGLDFKEGTVYCAPEGTAAKNYRQLFKPVQK